MKYKAQYRTPKATGATTGTFDFDSEAKAKTRQNAIDARIAMLEQFGNEALSWTVVKVERV